ncbi:5 [Durusdinium trenchii]|uniref:10-methylenetetrahydrofolate reductase n=1 Tax=Durusdinium trenchii TaxID=1381693 RepID=A0ABP0QKI8_9DINO
MSAATRAMRSRCVRLSACALSPLSLFCLGPGWMSHLPRPTGRRIGNHAVLERLQRLGRNISVEVSPAPAGSPKRGAVLREHQFPQKSSVFVNMVKTTADHFVDVADTSRDLAKSGFDPIPHVPISRLATSDDFHSTLKMLVEAGAKQLLVVGGNDLRERLERNELQYRSVSDLLEVEMGRMKSEGIQSVALAGLPDSPKWRGWNEKAATKVLVDKARLILHAGLQVVVATQFCFNPRQLLQWLRKTSAALKDLERELGRSNSVSFRIGVPGPTSLAKLRRIADLCQVPGDFLYPGMFDLVLQGATRVPPEDLENSTDILGPGLERSFAHDRRTFLRQCAGADGLLGRPELAELLWLVQAEEEEMPIGEMNSRQASGPSALVVEEEEASGCSLVQKDILWALAAQDTAEIEVNLYPFGGLDESLSLARSLREGRL